jgi:hypothetical protein
MIRHDITTSDDDDGDSMDTAAIQRQKELARQARRDSQKKR